MTRHYQRRQGQRPQLPTFAGSTTLNDPVAHERRPKALQASRSLGGRRSVSVAQSMPVPYVRITHPASSAPQEQLLGLVVRCIRPVEHSRIAVLAFGTLSIPPFGGHLD